MCTTACKEVLPDVKRIVPAVTTNGLSIGRKENCKVDTPNLWVQAVN